MVALGLMLAFHSAPPCPTALPQGSNRGCYSGLDAVRSSTLPFLKSEVSAESRRTQATFWEGGKRFQLICVINENEKLFVEHDTFLCHDELASREECD